MKSRKNNLTCIIHSRHYEERSDVVISNEDMAVGTTRQEITTSEQVPPRNDDYEVWFVTEHYE